MTGGWVHYALDLDFKRIYYVYVLGSRGSGTEEGGRGREEIIRYIDARINGRLFRTTLRNK